MVLSSAKNAQANKTVVKGFMHKTKDLICI